MKLLVLDFLSRWRWAALAFMLATMIAAAFDRGLPLAPLALLCFMRDWQTGLVRVARPLPVSARGQSFAWWFICVALLPLLALIAMPLGSALGMLHSGHRSPVDSWFAIATGWWIGLGFSALLFLPQTRGQHGDGSSLLGRAWFALQGMAFCIAFPGIMLVHLWIPDSAAKMQPVHWMACAAVPVLVVWSLVQVLRRPYPVMPMSYAAFMAQSTSAHQTAQADQRGLSGMPALVLMMHGPILRMLLFMIGVYYLICFLFLKQGSHVILEAAILPQMMAMATVMGGFSPDVWNMRSLRMLPVSTTKLALLLISVPLVQGLMIGLLCRIAAVTLEPSWTAAFLTAVLGTLCLTAGVRLSYVKRMFVIVPLFLTVLGASILGMKTIVPWMPYISVAGTGLIVMGYGLIHHGLRRSSGVYQVRPLAGACQMPLRG